MISNNEFGLIVRKGKTYINLLNSIDNNENVIEIDGNKYNINAIKFNELKKLVEKNILDFVKVSKEQTQTYLNENALDGFISNITFLVGGLSVYVNSAVACDKTKKLTNAFIEKLKNIIIG